MSSEKSQESENESSLEDFSSEGGGEVKPTETAEENVNSEEDEFEYEGEADGDGNPHGQGTMRWVDGNVFEGNFEHGERKGEGCFRFSDGGSLRGYWTVNGIHGVGLYTFADGNFQEGVYHEGQLSGPCVEWDSTGFITFVGFYKEGSRCGLAELRELDGGYLVGTYGQDELIDGDNVIYVYPGEKYALKGTWENGDMKTAKFCVINQITRQYVYASSEHISDEPSSKKCRRQAESEYSCRLEEAYIRNVVEHYVHPDFKELTFTSDESTDKSISSFPLLVEPLESILTYVAPSKIQGANEGLFAKIDLESDQLVSIYNGIRLSHPEVDSRPWESNSNTITLDDDIVIDVPRPFDDTNVYRASLGHKVNHWPTPNAKYAPLCHPRFGYVKSIRTIKPVKAGEEILVRYDYQHTDEEGKRDIPSWYLVCENRAHLDDV